MSFLREPEQQLLAVSDIRPPARRRVEQLRESPVSVTVYRGLVVGTATECSTQAQEVRHL